MFNAPYMSPGINSLGEMVWINSKNELQNIVVQPNKQKVFFLRDINNPVFYVVAANDIGMVSISAYTFTELVEQKPEDKFVTKEEFQKLLDALGGKDHAKPINEKV